MRNFLLILSFLLLSCSGSNKKEIEWMKNGTLHKSTISDWKKSTDENKLATCADFSANLKSAENQKYKTISEMKDDAVNLKACIEEAINGGNYADNMKVKEVAVMCHIIMKSTN